MNYELEGRVLDAATNEAPTIALTARVLRRRGRTSQVLATSEVESDGSYTLIVDDSNVQVGGELGQRSVFVVQIRRGNRILGRQAQPLQSVTPGQPFVLDDLVLELPTSNDDLPDGERSVSGSVTETEGSVTVGVIVRVFEERTEDQLGEDARTDAQGFYRIAYSADDLADPGAPEADLVARAFNEAGQVVAEERAPGAGNQATVDLRLGPFEPSGRVVRGQVAHAFGDAIVGHRVRAYHEKLFSATLVGESVLESEEGTYAISYELPDGVACVDLRVRVFDNSDEIDDSDEETALATSNLVTNAKQDELIDLLIRGTGTATGRIEYEDIGKTPRELETEQRDLSNLRRKAADKAKRSLFDNLRRNASSDLVSYLDRLEPSFVAEDGEDLRDQLLTRLKAYHPSDSGRSLCHDDDSAGVLTEATQRAVRIRAAASPEDLLLPDVPLAQNPLFSREVQQARLRQIGTRVGVGEAKVEAVVQRAGTLAGIHDSTLQAAVDAGELDEGEAKALGFGVGIYLLADEDDALVERLRTQTQAESLRDLAHLSRDEWLHALDDPQIDMTGGNGVEEYADVLRSRIAQLYPSASLFGRLASLNSDDLTDNLRTLEATLVSEGSLFGAGGLKPVDTESLSDEQRAAFEAVVRNVNAYPGFDLKSVVDDASTTSEEKADAFSRAAGLLEKLETNNPSLEFIRLDYTAGSADLDRIDFSWLADEEGDDEEIKQALLGTIKTYRRAYGIAGEVGDAEALVKAGYHSVAFTLASTPAHEVAADTGISEAAVAVYRERAASVVSKATADVLTIEHLVNGGFRSLRVANQPAELDDYLKEIPGFEDLFGSQDYCGCEECASILGAAAYFVDLMYFVETNILDEAFSGNDEHVLHLGVRRPDLWTLELTCDHTTKLIPYLTVVNEVLEDYVYRQEVGTVLGERAEIKSAVYEVLANAERSFSQPFDLALEELTTYLSHFDTTRGDVASTLGREDTDYAIARLGLSQRTFEIITQPNVDEAHLKTLYRTETFEADDNNAAKYMIDAQELLEPMSLSRVDLGDLVATNFVTAEGDELLEITGEKRSDESVQNDVERVHGLTLGALDRMHRFTRLRSALSWTIPELDLVLQHLKERGLSDGIEGDTLAALARLADLKERLGMSVEVLTALWSTLPTVALSEDKGALIDRLFNLDSFVDIDNGILYPDASVTFTHPAFHDDGTVENAQARLLAGMQVDDEALYQLIVHLSEPLGLDLSTEGGKTGVDLSLENLTFLYRHARLASLLELGIEDLFQLIRYTQSVSIDYIDSLDGLEALLAFHDWWASTTYALDDLGFITGAEGLDDDAYPDVEAVRDELVASVAEDAALTFADTVFAYLDGITEEQSRTLIASDTDIFEPAWDRVSYVAVTGIDPATVALSISEEISASESDIRDKIRELNDTSAAFDVTAFAELEGVSEEQSRTLVTGNPDVFEPAWDSIDEEAYWLANAFDPVAAMPVLPEGTSASEDELRGVLEAYHVRTVLPNYLGTLLELDADRVEQFVTMAGEDASAPEYARALQGDPASVEQLGELIRRVLPLSVLFGNAVFSSQVLSFIQNHADLFDIADFNAVTVSNIKTITLLETFLGSAEEADELDDLEAVLGAYDPDNPFADVDRAALARLVGADESLVKTVLDAKTVPEGSTWPTSALDALGVVRTYVELAQSLGVSGAILPLIVSTEYDSLQQAASAVLSAFRAKYDEDEWEEKSEAYEDRLNELKRDGLTDYVLSRAEEDGYGPFKDLRDLYHYFLLDVQMEGCGRTSRVVAAISSVQLYVHRCLMLLEQSEDGEVVVEVPEEAIEEWTWRRNYRVWQANRVVFLNPEHYLYESLRDNKTPLFEELEQTLLQQDVNPDTVLDAYAAYMRGFEEVANLKIAGSYHDIGDESDVLHLFGVTPSDPPTYYYRTAENVYHSEADESSGVAVSWNPWVPIDVQIPVRRVSPIVFRGRLYVFWVEIVTRAENEFVNGSSEFIGYQHTMALKFTTLRLDGSWTAPQSVSLMGPDPFVEDEGGLWEAAYASGSSGRIVFRIVYHDQPNQGYTLTGIEWEQVYPSNIDDRLAVTGAGWQLSDAPIDMYTLALEKDAESESADGSGNGIQFEFSDSVNIVGIKSLSARSANGQRSLFSGGGITGFDVSSLFPAYGDSYAEATIIAEEARIEEAEKLLGQLNLDSERLYQTEIARLGSDVSIDIVNGSVEDALLDASGDLFLIQGSVRSGDDYVLQRIGTTLGETISATLFSEGIGSLLALESQQSLEEAAIPFSTSGHIEVEGSRSYALAPDYTGPYGVYLREIYFHIPLLLAEHLNSQQHFAEARAWFHYLFDPTAKEPSGGSATAADRYWRYREFREYDAQTLREQLTDQAAIEEYKKNPFSPWAIARLRLVALQKAVVLKYVDNLIDEGDALFAQDNTESINEATLLYVMAADILGERPAELGDCGEAGDFVRSYENIAPILAEAVDSGEGSEFLIEMEHFALGSASEAEKESLAFSFTPALNTISRAVLSVPSEGNLVSVLSDSDVDDTAEPDVGTALASAEVGSGMFNGSAWRETKIAGWNVNADSLVETRSHDSSIAGTAKARSSFELDFLRQTVARENGDGSAASPVFCVPFNDNLIDYHDRVEDRLFKIRNCMNISGVRRELSLFAPVIDPMILVRAKAAGLSLDDVLNSIGGDLPPYRFTYLIEKAKSYAQSLQGFGSALLSALEKKDSEELTKLRALHETNVLALTTEIREKEIEAAQTAIEELDERRAAVSYRKAHYDNLIDTGLIDSEKAQQAAQGEATTARNAESVLNFASAYTHFIPEAGAPTAMKFGGKQIADSLNLYAAEMRTIATLADSRANASGREASDKRREQEWEFQRDLADTELLQLDKQKVAAEFRKEIAERSLEVHEQSIEQADDVYEFFGDKFTGLGLYTWLSTTLHRLYRMAYNGAYQMARLAEQAYRFERGDDTLTIGSHWDASRAGLLAGEQLLQDLQSLERRFIETNYRKLEVTQTFSLLQIDPQALITLRDTGTGGFTIPEFYYDLFYPGQYNRRIKAVRLTIPAVTGPFTNVSASLTLQKSYIRTSPDLGETSRKEVPKTRTVSIAASTARNDSGVFEFSFRDERYVPFENSGADSKWQLSLPAAFRPFNYDTISDVLLEISYEAEYDGVLKLAVEGSAAEAEGSLRAYLESNELYRLFSLKRDFPTEFHKLLTSPQGADVMITLSDRHYPMFLAGYLGSAPGLEVSGTRAVLVVSKEAVSVEGFEMEVNDQKITKSEEEEKDLGDLPAYELGEPLALIGEHHLKIINTGDLAAPDEEELLDASKLTDIYLLVGMKMKAGSS